MPRIHARARTGLGACDVVDIVHRGAGLPPTRPRYAPVLAGRQASRNLPFRQYYSRHCSQCYRQHYPLHYPLDGAKAV